jgi:hypothetical protein
VFVKKVFNPGTVKNKAKEEKEENDDWDEVDDRAEGLKRNLKIRQGAGKGTKRPGDSLHYGTVMKPAW